MRKLSNPEIEALYAQRSIDIQTLASKGRVVLADLWKLDRLGRFTIACEYWDISDSDAQNALLSDMSPHVQSAARLSKKHGPEPRGSLTGTTGPSSRRNAGSSADDQGAKL
jgi:hypothetical protein